MSWLYAVQARTEAYLKPSNEICNVLISFLSFNGGIERREGLGLYYHTLWREGRGREGERGYERRRESERGCGQRLIPACICGGNGQADVADGGIN